MEMKIERVDEIPMLLYWLKQTRVEEIVDSIWKPHGNWKGLTYGQLAVLFVVYVVHGLNHRLYQMEQWVEEHFHVISQACGWTLSSKDATDDRAGAMMHVLGSDISRCISFQRESGRHYIQAYALPTDVVRYDTTSFNVHHATSSKASNDLFHFGHGKDHRPDLLQFKQGLATLDPGGFPLFSETMEGNVADDTRYVPAWREMTVTIGHKHFLYIADCKAAALSTRGIIDHEGGRYLFPLPMTGEVPAKLKALVTRPPAKPEAIYRHQVETDRTVIHEIGRGFCVNTPVSFKLELETVHNWDERWFIVQSRTYARTQAKAIMARLKKAQTELGRLKPKKNETGDQLCQRAQKILKDRSCLGLIDLEARETIVRKEKHMGRGRPKADSPRIVEEITGASLSFQRNRTAIAEAIRLAGWRIYVTNVPSEAMTLEQSVRYYREEWVVERGFHRFKEGSLPALPIYLHLPERIRGFMMLLSVALQVITLIEFVARKNLAASNEPIAGLVPGNPKMKTLRPTTERLLAPFKGLHLLVEKTSESIKLRLIEELKPIQEHILHLLGIPPDIYALHSDVAIFNDTT
ncbi:IS1634 family transposase [Desulforhabdus sp. TSK]|uniref:IS1634 family transposase n=1 Tax=Desulforhabdus sp. TSK TaxID=2925014 RepID=UPI001FC88B22|nr:IS1634 family transposase [Desulforhabdus sp. TSK]GKT07141.1 hypothetical protein DSTSK_04460 [Desulforhabdus sp. TSK]